MSGIGSTLRRHWVEIAWGLFAAANILVIVTLTRWETIPFHFVWVSLTIVYGFRTWRLSSTLAVLAVVVAVSTWALFVTVVHGSEHPDELTEVPLMAAMFLAMVWHARRRQTAVEEARRLAENEHRLAEGQREFVRDASHELRTPITIARGHAELARDADLSPRVREDVEVVIDELGRLSRLSERLLLLEAAGHPGFLSVERVDVDAVIAAVERRWKGAAGRSWRFTVREPGTIRLDRERFEIALDAVIENAVHVTEDADPVGVGAYREGDELILEVADAGPGIPEDQVDRVFDRFSRADDHRARGGGGTGLGLPIARAIARAHGGDLTVCSPGNGGTTMRFKLPGFEAAVARPPAAPVLTG
jgi:signal transduction histidine kinase